MSGSEVPLGIGAGTTLADGGVGVSDGSGSVVGGFGEQPNSSEIMTTRVISGNIILFIFLGDAKPNTQGFQCRVHMRVHVSFGADDLPNEAIPIDNESHPF